MGAFYGSIQIRSEDRDAVKAAVESVAQECKQKFLLGPLLKGWIAIYPDGSGQDDACAAALAKRLSDIVLQLIIHHDDVFAYNFFRDGELLNSYSSRPDYFGKVSAAEHERLKPKPDLFGDLINSPEKLAEIIRILDTAEKSDEFTFEQNRLEQFAKLLGIQNSLTSYEYLMAGERDGVKRWREFVHIPDQTPEKTAKKEAEAALRREKLEWKRKGLLCNEWPPPCRKHDEIHSWADFCVDPLNGGFLALWRRSIGFGYPPQLVRLQSPWDSKPPLLDYAFPSKDPHSLTISPKGYWLAFSDGGLRLWDWRSQRLVNDIQIDASPVTFSQDETFLLCRGGQKLEVVSLESRQIIRTIPSETCHSGVPTLHPSGRFLIVRYSQDQLGIISLATGKLDKVLFYGPIMDWSDLAPAFVSEFKQAGVSESDLNKWKQAFVRGSHKIMKLKFSSDGCLLFCATTGGLHVLEWDRILAASETTPEPLLKGVPHPEASYHTYENYIYDVTLDKEQNRLLFCGIEGTIRFLNLDDGRTGILVQPPGKSPMWQLELSSDRKFICCLCCPATEDRNRKPPRLQVWNYIALCKAVGLE